MRMSLHKEEKDTSARKSNTELKTRATPVLSKHMETEPEPPSAKELHQLLQEPEPEEEEEEEQRQQQQQQQQQQKQILSSYLGLSFSIFLASLPKNSVSLVPALKTQKRELSLRLFQAEEQLKQMKSRRKEDSKANARVVEIFASHRNAWQAEEKRLLQQIEAAGEEVASVRAQIQDLRSEREDWLARVQDLEREVGEREEMIGFMSRNASAAAKGGGGLDFVAEEGMDEEEESGGGCGSSGQSCGGVEDEESVKFVYAHHQQQQQEQHYHRYPQLHQEAGSNLGFGSDFLASASKLWADTACPWQDIQYESLDSLYHMKHFVARRESPWKVDGESTGVSSKLKLLEQELLNLENVGKNHLSKVPSLMRKQAKRYQALSGKIDDLCRRMQASDPCEPTISLEFRTQRQTEFLLEAFRLQQHASETGQKLMALQTEIGRSYYKDKLGNEANFSMRRSFDSIRNNLKEVQRNLEIWLARIIGDLEGILARDSAKEYYISRYPFVQ